MRGRVAACPGSGGMTGGSAFMCSVIYDIDACDELCFTSSKIYVAWDPAI